MTLDEFLTMCKAKNWSELISLLSSNLKDLSLKITASAVIGAHHPDPDKAKQYGLSLWDKSLADAPVSPIFSLYTSAVDLTDFTKAYMLAKAQNGLNDLKVAQVIFAYVQANKMQLSTLLESNQVSDELREQIIQIFGGIKQTKAQKEAYYKKEFLLQAREKIAFIQAKEQVGIALQKLFNLKPKQCRVSFSQLLNMRGIASMSMDSPGRIFFAEEVPNEQLEKFANNVLKEQGIQASYYNLSLYGNPNNRGIQLWDSPQNIMRKFSKVALLEQKASVSPVEFIGNESLDVAPLSNAPAALGRTVEEKQVTTSEWKNTQLTQRVTFYCVNEKDIKGLSEEISQLIERAVKEHNPRILEEFFGTNAFDYCLNLFEMKQLTDDFKAKKIDYIEYATKFFTANYLPLALYWACIQGSLPVTKYLFEKQHFEGTLSENLSGVAHHLPSKEPMKGPPLLLAVKSNNLDVVRYVYENTQATVETCIENPTEPTALMVAVALGYEKIVAYLLEKGGNPNSEVFANNTTPLKTAISNNSQKIIALLVNAGAIVTSAEVRLAIECSADLNLIELLLQHSINRESLFKPYLISAVQSGNIALLQDLETHTMISSFEEIIAFNEAPIDKRLIYGAAASGSLDMMKHLVEVKKIDLKDMVLQENIKEEEYLNKNATTPDFQYSRERASRAPTILRTAVGQGSIPLIYYLFEELNLKPSNCVIEEICTMSASSLQAVAYMLSFLEQEQERAKEFRAIALAPLHLPFLFKIFTSALVLNGNPHELYSSFRGFIAVVAAMIKKQESGLSSLEILKLVQEDKEAAKGALFYFCTQEFDKQSEKLAFLLTRLVGYSGIFSTVDIQNGNGDSLAYFAYSQGAANIAKMLLARGANPDLANKKGKTFLNQMCLRDSSGKEDVTWIQPYVQQVTNSLRYASKALRFARLQLSGLLKFSAGQTHGVSILELTENCISSDSTYEIEQKLTDLFVHLSEQNAQQLVYLLKNEAFLAKNPKFKQCAAGYLAKFAAIDESVLPASSKARRLRTDAFSVSASSLEINSIFSHNDSILEKEKEAQATISRL